MSTPQHHIFLENWRKLFHNYIIKNTLPQKQSLYSLFFTVFHNLNINAMEKKKQSEIYFFLILAPDKGLFNFSNQKYQYFSCFYTKHTVFDLITAHTPIRGQSSNSIVFRLQPVYFCLLLYKGICYEYSFELHRLVDAIQMSTHNICFYKENQKKIA